MHFKRKPSPEHAARMLARMEEIAPSERTFLLYPAVRCAALGLTYSPSAPHFEEDCPSFPNWERKGSEPWKKIP